MLHEEIVRDEVLAAKCRRLGLEPWGVPQPLEVDGAGEEEVKEEMEEMEEVLVENEEHEASKEHDEQQGSEEVADLRDQASDIEAWEKCGVCRTRRLGSEGSDLSPDPAPLGGGRFTIVFGPRSRGGALCRG